MNIVYLREHETIRFAAEELQRYLASLSFVEAVAVHPGERYATSQPSTIWLGLEEDLVADVDFPDGRSGDSPFDDRISIATTATAGVIAGANPRSVLLGVYRYLREQGFSWIRPGKEGERVPDDLHELRSVRLSTQPAYRHRGICIEGALSEENLLDMIDWLPKVGLNSYFIQFREAYTFFHRWYAHHNNSTLAAEHFSIDEARQIVARAEAEISKRSLIYHAVGHGWTCEPLGIRGLGWDPGAHELTPEMKNCLAEVNGERTIWQNIALNTNLCYSQPKVQRMIIQEIVAYVQNHDNVDILHFWLADTYNNQCECADCRRMLPSDYYVQMLNELDRQLTALGCRTRIVFLIYFELLWPPKTETIINEERFILMFAPITRTYSRPFEANPPFLAEPTTPELPDFERNNIRFSAAVEDNLAFLMRWQQQFKGDSFSFDYHMMWDHYADPGYYVSAHTLYKDIVHLKHLGLNGYVSCQVQRAFFPTGFNMFVLARTLWDTEQSFDQLAGEYFAEAFGEDGTRCLTYVQRLSELFEPAYLRGETKKLSAELAAQFSGIPAVIEQFKPVIDKNSAEGHPVHVRSWQLLAFHAEYAILLARCLQAKASGNDELLQKHWLRLLDVVQEKEMKIQSVFDVFEFVHVMKSRLLDEYQIV